jgi:hypothetical protein
MSRDLNDLPVLVLFLVFFFFFGTLFRLTTRFFFGFFGFDVLLALVAVFLRTFPVTTRRLHAAKPDPPCSFVLAFSTRSEAASRICVLRASRSSSFESREFSRYDFPTFVARPAACFPRNRSNGFPARLRKEKRPLPLCLFHATPRDEMKSGETEEDPVVT